MAQTGVQILFAFLLTIPFQSAFAALSEFQNDIYLATLLSAAVAVVLLIAPVATHRLLFRRRQKDELVRVTARLAGGGLTFLAIAILGAVLLIVDLVSGGVAATIVTAALAVLARRVLAGVPRLLAAAGGVRSHGLHRRARQHRPSNTAATGRTRVPDRTQAIHAERWRRPVLGGPHRPAAARPQSRIPIDPTPLIRRLPSAGRPCKALQRTFGELSTILSQA